MSSKNPPKSEFTIVLKPSLTHTKSRGENCHDGEEFDIDAVIHCPENSEGCCESSVRGSDGSAEPVGERGSRGWREGLSSGLPRVAPHRQPVDEPAGAG